MKITMIKHVLSFVNENDEDYVHESIELLEHMADAPGLSDDDLEVVGELISNFYGALEVHQQVKEGTPQKEALNAFMKRVMGSVGS